MARRSDARNGLKTNERGYGLEHKKLRAKLERLVAAGEAVCWRCGLPIHPGEPFDLGHDDHNRSVYRGAEHARCNRATASRRNGAEPLSPPIWSRCWCGMARDPRCPWPLDKCKSGPGPW